MKFGALLLTFCWQALYLSSVTCVNEKQSVKSVLMVCTFNHAVSPIAQAVFKDLAKRKGVDSQWRCDSAGLDVYEGLEMHDLAATTLREHGIEPGNHSCRYATEDDFNKHDFALAMNRENLKDMRAISLSGSTAKLELLPSYDPLGKRIIKEPTTWAKRHAYEEIYQIINRSCNAFLDAHSNFKTMISRDTTVANLNSDCSEREFNATTHK